MWVTVALKANHGLDLKDSSRDFQPNCVISLFFIYIEYSMHVSKDSMGWMKIFWQGLSLGSYWAGLLAR